MLRCPVCSAPLEEQAHALCCPNRHSFDRAASGYVNLLLTNKRHSDHPGDGKEMLQARRDFLAAGYYDFLREELGRRIAAELAGKCHSTVVDVGCGEGYYTARFAQLAQQADPTAQVYGFDLAKDGLKTAAKRDRQSLYAVASLGDLPLFDSSVDVMVNVFAPYSDEEFGRVIRPGGLLLTAVPAEDHLYGLKSFLYDQPYQNVLAPYSLPHFALAEQATLRQEAVITPGSLIWDLFQMTPYYWKTARAASDRLRGLDRLETPLHFGIYAYRRLPC